MLVICSYTTTGLTFSGSAIATALAQKVLLFREKEMELVHRCISRTKGQTTFEKCTCLKTQVLPKKTFTTNFSQSQNSREAELVDQSCANGSYKNKRICPDLVGHRAYEQMNTWIMF